MIQFDEHIFQTGWNHQLVYLTIIFDIMGISGYPPKAKPNKPLLREINGYSNSPLIRPYFLGGGWHWGGTVGFPSYFFSQPPRLDRRQLHYQQHPAVAGWWCRLGTGYEGAPKMNQDTPGWACCVSGFFAGEWKQGSWKMGLDFFLGGGSKNRNLWQDLRDFPKITMHCLGCLSNLMTPVTYTPQK